MQGNSPPHNDEYEILDSEDLIEVQDENDINFLGEEDDIDFHEDGATENEADEDMEDDEIEEEGDEAKINVTIYKNHTAAVFCCALSPSDNIAASGGEDDLAYVWNADDGSTIFECTGHKDSVTSLGFSYDGTYLATGDMSGFVQVWKISTNIKIWEFETDDLNWLTWHHSSNVLFAGTSSGEVWMWLVTKGNTKSLSHTGTSTECGSLTRDGKRICVGYTDGTVKVFDLKSGQAINSFNSHSSHIICLSCHQDNKLVMSGSADGKAKLLNTITGKELGTFDCGIEELNSDEECVEAVSFCPTNPNLAVTATLSGLVTVWDISSQTSRHHIVQGCGSSFLLWHPKEPYFLTAGLDGILRVYDVRSADQKFKFKGPHSTIMSCDIKADGSKLISAFNDGTVRVLDIRNLLNT